jgi:hypothetical protein
MLTLITPTGARPQAFAICEILMRRQSYAGAVHWIVIDDGPEPTPLSKLKSGWTREIVRPLPFWALGQNTQGRNLLAGIDAAEMHSGDALRLVVIEDDDYYHPAWLETIAGELDRAELVGEVPARYYNVKWCRYDTLRNDEHASLRCSAMRGGALATFRNVLATPHIYYDIRLWLAHDDKKTFSSRLTVGMKGLPGREGIALGHREIHGRFDPNWRMLHQWLGDDAALYEGYYERGRDMKARTMICLKPFRYATRKLATGDRFEVGNKKEAAVLRAIRKADFAPDGEVQAKMKKERAAPKPVQVPWVEPVPEPKQSPMAEPPAQPGFVAPNTFEDEMTPADEHFRSAY